MRGAVWLAVMLTAGGAQAAGLRCPAAMPGPHDGFEQMGPVPTRARPLLALRLFDGPPGEETREAPADLAPDSSTTRPGGFTNIWSFGGDEQLLMLCAYRDTDSYYRRVLKPLPKACTMTQAPEGVVASCD